MPYERLDALLTPAELAYFHHLQAACQGQAVLLAFKVRLADLVAVKAGTRGRQGAWNRIKAKHVDFVLCHAESTEPLLAIELDDASHGRASRQKRDHFVDHCLAAAGVPLHRERAKAKYSIDAIRASIEGYLPATRPR